LPLLYRSRNQELITIRQILNYGNGRICKLRSSNVNWKNFSATTSPNFFVCRSIKLNGRYASELSLAITANPSNFIVQKSQKLTFSARSNVLVSGADRTYRVNATVSGGNLFFQNICAKQPAPINPAKLLKNISASVTTDQ